MFSKPGEAQEAINKNNGRFFGGRTIVAKFIAESLFSISVS